MKKRYILLFSLFGGLVMGFGPGGFDFSADLGGGFTLWRPNSQGVTVLSYGATKDIPPRVDECATDRSRFILALRRDPKDSELEGPQPRVKEDFWLIDRVSPTWLIFSEVKLYGPMDKASFDGLKLKLGVPASLVLKDIYQFRPD
jgi:hypothetical protein